MKIWLLLAIPLLLTTMATSLSQVFPFGNFINSQYITKLPNNTLKIKYVPSNRGTPVITAPYVLPKIYGKEVTLEYDVMFDKNFEWVRGGKLPGLLSQNRRAVGCVQPHPADGWSFRLMWRNDARIAMYIYDQSRVGGQIRCGSVLDSRSNTLAKDKWINFKMYMKLNSNSSTSNGVAKLYVNNILTLSRAGIKFSGRDNASIYHLSFDTFYGGHDPSWSPNKTTYAYIRGATVHDRDLARI